MPLLHLLSGDIANRRGVTKELQERATPAAGAFFKVRYSIEADGYGFPVVRSEKALQPAEQDVAGQRGPAVCLIFHGGY